MQNSLWIKNKLSKFNLICNQIEKRETENEPSTNTMLLYHHVYPCCIGE